MKELNLLYKQFCVFNKGLENPFNEWNDNLIQQGFSIRTESLSIMTISSEGLLDINILQEDKILECAKRILEFEFEVVNDCIEIATITDSFYVNIKKGIYKIRIQLYSEFEGKDVCYISFLKINKNEELPRYLKCDKDITKTSDFIIGSKAAT